MTNLGFIDKLMIPVRVLIVLALAYSIAMTILFMFFGSNQDSDTDSGTVPPHQPMTPAITPADITSANLFGSLPEELEAPLKETTLNLKLQGVFFNESNPAESSAVIVDRSNGKSTLYRTGERVGGVAEVSEIQSDRVILTRAGQRELLTFDPPADPIFELVRESSQIFTPDGTDGFLPQSALASADDESSWLGQFYRNFGERLVNAPEEVFDEWGITPVSQNSAEGYHVSSVLAERTGGLGLRSGDIVTSVNGHQVGDIAQDLSEFRRNLNTEELELEIQRGETTLKISLKSDPNYD